jgi:lysophospholipid acyltransferase (LPLAT)-like uncharacterized protein
MKERLISLLAIAVVHAISLTLRYRREGFFELGSLNSKGCAIWVFWHNRIFGMARGLRGPYRGGKAVVLTSASKDGEILARVVGSFGLRAARGSSSRRGSRALRELTKWIDGGYNVVVTPDGPRGPRYVLAPGVIFLAQKTGLPIVPVHLNYDRYWTLKSWDRFMIPKPFSRVRVVVASPERIPAVLAPDEFEAQRLRIEKLLNDGREDDNE